MNKTFPIRGHCLSTNPIIVKYLKDNFKRYKNNVDSKKVIGVAWSENRWWYVIHQSNTPKYDPLIIMITIKEISEMKNLPITEALSTSGRITPGNTICTTTTTPAPIYNPNDIYDIFFNNIWIYGSGAITVKNLVTEPTKLRIKCRNLKKNLKVSLMQINLK